jgi:hypothetical protein
MGLAHAALAMNFGGLYGFYAAVSVVGAAFGSTFSLSVVVTSELWGLKNMGANYMVFDGFYQFVGTIGVAKVLVQTIYSHNLAADEHTCFGVQCFRGSHVIVSLMCLAGAACLVLVSRGAQDTSRPSPNLWD